MCDFAGIWLTAIPEGSGAPQLQGLRSAIARVNANVDVITAASDRVKERMADMEVERISLDASSAPPDKLRYWYQN